MRVLNGFQEITRGIKTQVERVCQAFSGTCIIRTPRSLARRRQLTRALRQEMLEERSMFYGGNGLEFNISATAAVPLAVREAFQVAAGHWSTLLKDDIRRNVTIDYTANASGVGQTFPVSSIASLSDIHNALIADQRSLSDLSALSHLPSGSSASLYTTNYNTGLPFLDNNNTDNNTSFRITRANAKALGLIPANDPASDGTIKFLSSSPFDYNQADGVAPGKYDFIAVATHEIGHLLGFISGADEVDFKSKPNGPGYNSLANQDNQIVARPLDLFRFSAGSVAAGADFDLRADKADKYFSVDGGATHLASFSTGAYNGNGRENQHWKDNLGLGVMDPTLALGEYGSVTARDVQALDVIGWDIEMDYGDAPDTAPGASTGNYQTTLAENGPRHATFQPSGLISDPVGTAKVFLGAGVDVELNGQPNAAASGDDLVGSDDESGVAIFPILSRGTSVSLLISSSATAIKNAKLDYFFDFNRNGVFNDAGEVFSATLASTWQSVPVIIPVGASLGDTFARFRISTSGGLGPTGPANDGEVEDYKVSIVNEATLQGTSGDDHFNVMYSPNNVVVTLSTGAGSATLLGTFGLDTTLTLDGLGGNDDICFGFTPFQLGELSTTGLQQLNQYLTSPTGKVFGLLVPTAAGLNTKNFEALKINANDHNAIYDITQCMLAITNKSQIQIGNDGGDDVIQGTNLTDLIFGQGGNDRIDGLGGNDYLFGGLGSDALYGGDGDDLLNGSDGIDALYGDAGNDSLFGGEGNDYFLGGDGADSITTGGGSDKIIFAGDVGSVDTITDFSASLDRIILQAYQVSYASLSFDTASIPGTTDITLPNGKKIRLLNWNKAVVASQFVF